MKELSVLFFTFFKIGLFTFGGGYAMIAQIRETVMENKKWLTEEELLQIIAIAESTPGPIAINMATYIGYKKKGIPGSVSATFGVVLPSFMIVFIISLFADKFLNNKYIRYAFSGINSAVAFMILKTGISMFKKMKKNFITVIGFIAVLILTVIIDIFAVNFSSVYFIILGGIVGIAANCIYNYKDKESALK